MDSPVAFIIFNRPEKTRRVFKAIAKAKPGKLFVIADGPRRTHPSDTAKCKAARSAIDAITWPCDVRTNFSDENLGCGRRPATGISWVLDQVDRAIILEDDCLPDPTFFRYCDELLERYLDNPKIMQINGTNLQLGRFRTSDSYYFMSSNICWGGWATWQRAWRHHDLAVKQWPTLKGSTWLFDILENQQAVDYWSGFFNQAYQNNGNVSFWDYQWRLSVWEQNGLAISPREPLIANIGYDSEGTHTNSSGGPYARLKKKKMKFPMRHPSEIRPVTSADQFLTEQLLNELNGSGGNGKFAFLHKVLVRFKHMMRQGSATRLE